MAAHLIGRDREGEDATARAHQEYLRLGDAARAARCAFWLGMGLLNRGEMARGAGWLGRSRRVLEEAQLDCVEQGFLLVPLALQSLDGGDLEAAYASFDQAGKIAELSKEFARILTLRAQLQSRP